MLRYVYCFLLFFYFVWCVYDVVVKFTFAISRPWWVSCWSSFNPRDLYYRGYNNNNNNNNNRVNNRTQPPDDSVTHKQKIWDKIVVDVEYSHLSSRYSEPYHRARLLAAAAPHSGDWHHTLPLSACGLHLHNNAICVAVGLLLGCAICEAHSCPCGVMVDPLSQHALSCKKQSARVQRHAWLNCALIRAETPAVKEPQGLSRDDGKRPDGLTLIAWQSRRSATWDDSCSHTGNILRVAKCATDRKCCSGRVCEKDNQVQYALRQSHVFFETLGPLSDEAHSLIAEIDRRATLCIADPQETTFLCQRISVTIQRFKQCCVPCQHVQSFRVPIVTVPDIHFCFC